MPERARRCILGTTAYQVNVLCLAGVSATDYKRAATAATFCKKCIDRAGRVRLCRGSSSPNVDCDVRDPRWTRVNLHHSRLGTLTEPLLKAGMGRADDPQG